MAKRERWVDQMALMTELVARGNNLQCVFRVDQTSSGTIVSVMMAPAASPDKVIEATTQEEEEVNNTFS